MSTTRKYDFSKFPRQYPATVRYSAISHVRGHLHMSRLRLDKFYILTGKGPDATVRKLLRPGVWEWTMEDQRLLVERALSETPFKEATNDVAADPICAVNGAR